MQLQGLHTIAARQHGVVARFQVQPLGIDAKRWGRLRRDGLLIEEFPGVARLAGAPAGLLATVAAATLAAGPDSRASHTSAAAVWGAPCNGTDPVHLLGADRLRRCRIDGIVLHRPRDRDEIDVVTRAGIRTTRPLRTLCDVGAVAPAAVSGVLEHFLIEGLFSPSAAWKALERHRRPGRTGVAALESALLGLALDAKPPDSVLEVVMAQLFRRHGLPPFTFHAHVAGYEVDFLVNDTNVVVETDGWSTHGLERARFERDREKDNVLAEAGYVVRRFTWRQVRQRSAWVAERIGRAVARSNPGLLAGSRQVWVPPGP